MSGVLCQWHGAAAAVDIRSRATGYLWPREIDINTKPADIGIFYPHHAIPENHLPVIKEPFRLGDKVPVVEPGRHSYRRIRKHAGLFFRDVAFPHRAQDQGDQGGLT